MAWLIYTLCTITAATCAVLLLTSFARSGYRLLLWSGLCFVGLTMNNLLLVIDKVVLPEADLVLMRSAVALVSMCMLLYGFVWDSE